MMGVHTIGRANPKNSGYEGPWSENPGVFDNNYYRTQLVNGWVPKNVNPGKNQWGLAHPLEGKEDLMMLNTDMCLGWNHNKAAEECVIKQKYSKWSQVKCANTQILGKGHFINAAEVLKSKEKTCCSFFMPNPMLKRGWRDLKDGSGGKVMLKQVLFPGEPGKKGEFCGAPLTTWRTYYPEAKKRCCNVKDPSDMVDCDAAGWPKGPGFESILEYTRDMNMWLKKFYKVWQRATSGNSLTAVYQLKDGPATLKVTPVDWSKETVYHKM